jgi:glycosyltransferase involved in cell wall biosynthesis
MHIVLVNRWYPPHSGYGGVAVYNRYLAHALVKRGHRVTVVAARWSPDVPGLHEDNGVTVHRLLSQHRYRIHRLPIIGRYVRPLQQFLYSFQVARKLRELEVEDCPDVVEFAEVNAEGFVYLLRRRHCPVVVRCHTPTFVLRRYYTPAEMPYDTSLTTVMEKFCIHHADALTAPSHDMAGVIAKGCRTSPERITVVPNALDVKLFSPDRRRSTDSGQPTPNSEPQTSDFGLRTSDGLIVLHVGRLHRVKGVEVLARAISQVLQEVPHARFVFIGDDCPDGSGGTWQRRLEVYFREQGVDGRTVFLGSVDQPTLIKWYRRADIAVVPSMLYESFSYTCAEAMAAGIPLVASRIGGIPETVNDGVNGLLVAPGDAEELACAIIQLAQDSNMRKRMGQSGRVRARRYFDALGVAQRFLELGNSLRKKRGVK